MRKRQLADRVADIGRHCIAGIDRLLVEKCLARGRNLLPGGMLNGWWMAAFFENGPISEECVWDEGVHQTVTMASFDHFVQILLIQILLILVFFAVSFYVFKKADMAKRNNFMYFPWMEKLFLWIFPFCVSLFIVVIGFKIQSYKGGVIAVVIASIVFYMIRRHRKRREA